MILSKKVEVSLFSMMRRKDYFISKGYDLDSFKKKVEQLPDRLFTNKDYTRIMVEINVDELSPTADVLVKVQCDYCNNVFETSYLILSLCEGKQPCPSCVPLKRKETNLKNYGVENPSQRQEIKDKKEKKSLEKYGTKNVLQANSIKEQIKQTNLERYGVENPQQNKDIQDKTKQTNLKVYGTENPMQNKNVIGKARKTNIGKHDSLTFLDGVTWRKSKYNDMISYFIYLGYDVVSSIFEFVNQDVSKEYAIKLKCKECKNEFQVKVNRLFHYDEGNIKCPFCNHNHTNSREEDRLYAFIRSIYSGEIVRNNRNILSSKKEIDIYLPELKLGIEYNGLYWHSEVFRKIDKHYHYDKMRDAESNGIKLFFIWSHEWKTERSKIEFILKQLLSDSTKFLSNKPYVLLDLRFPFLESYLKNGYQIVQEFPPESFLIQNGKFIGSEINYDLTRPEDFTKLGYDRVWNCGKVLLGKGRL